MSATNLLDELAAGRAPGLVPLSVDQFHRMIAAGILRDGEPVELIEGMLVRKGRGPLGGDEIIHGPHHALVVARLQRLSSRLVTLGCHLRSQLPVTLSAVDEPEPDLVIVRGEPDDFADRHPGPADVLLVVEVADSSLAFDRTTKQRLYAAAGIPAYWIINLPDDRIEVFEDPRPDEGLYGRHLEVGRAGTARVGLGVERLQVSAADVLSPRRV